MASQGADTYRGLKGYDITEFFTMVVNYEKQVKELEKQLEHGKR